MHKLGFKYSVLVCLPCRAGDLFFDGKRKKLMWRKDEEEMLKVKDAMLSL